MLHGVREKNKSRALPPTCRGRLTVLLVEDSATSRLLIRRTLGGFDNPGIDLQELASLREALALLEDGLVPDVVLLDLNLPDSAGFDTFAAMRRAVPDSCAVVILTALQDEAVALEMVRGGAQEYLGKEEMNARNLRRVILHAVERAQAAALRREHTRFLESAHKMGRLGPWQFARRTGRVSMPSQTCELFGLGGGGFEGGADEFLALVHTADVERVRAVMTGGDGKSGWHEVDYRVRLADGAERWLLQRCAEESGEDARDGLLCGVVMDVTERKNLEQRVLRAQRLDSIGTLAGGVAHDLNNVFSPILMFIGVLKRRMEGGDLANLVQGVEGCARRGADMVNQILSFARGLEGTRVEVQVRHILREIERVVTGTFPKNISLKLSLDKTVPPISGDPTQIHQVLMNLVINARDAMPAGGELSLVLDSFTVDRERAAAHGSKKTGRHARITVGDTGTGVPPEARDKLFDPFFTTKDPGKGTGLGLPTALSIVKAHGGFIEVRTQAGQGSEFVVCLPTSEEARSKCSADMDHDDFPRGDGELVLVVDDEHAVRQITRHALESYGFRVLTAGDGAEGVAVYSAHKAEIRLILTDRTMPVMDGFDFVRVLRTLDADVPILATTGGDVTRHGAKMRAVGASACLAKPFTAESLLRAVDGLLGRPAPQPGAAENPAGQTTQPPGAARGDAD